MTDVNVRGATAMGIFTPDVNTLRELYISTLEHTLNSERQIAEKGLPAMIDKATTPQLKAVFQQHLSETKQQIARLERMLDSEEGEVNEAKCKVTAALISQAESNVGDAANDQIRDIILIAAGNQVEHHEIAVYGTLRTWAEILGENDHVTMLERSLEEEENADDLLTELAAEVNVAAAVA
jgi:ferritin-like metal-binding protein YciE